MSHFALGVIVQASKVSVIHEYLDSVMEKFNENRDVPRYQKDCYCIEHNIHLAAEKVLASEMGTWDEAMEEHSKANAGKSDKKDRLSAMHDGYHNAPSDVKKLIENLGDEIRRDWLENYYAPRKERYDELKKELAEEYGKPDPHCTECNGTGKVISTYNPDSKWDWFTIGGRWDGFITDNKLDIPETNGGYNFSEINHTVENNTAPVSEHLASVETDKENRLFAYLTPDGVWHERGNMGWFGVVDNEKGVDGWVTEILTLLKEHQEGHVIVCVDCHI